jgi:hypothetical protein
VIYPRVPGDRERIHIGARKLMVLKEILRIPNVPPDIWIIHVPAVQGEDELNAYQN